MAPLTNSSKVKAKISKAVQKSQAKCTSQQRSYLILLENKVKGAGIILRRTRTSVFESFFFQYLPNIARLAPFGCVPFSESQNVFLILDLPDFAVERSVKSEIGFVTLVTFRQRVKYARQPLKNDVFSTV